MYFYGFSSMNWGTHTDHLYLAIDITFIIIFFSDDFLRLKICDTFKYSELQAGRDLSLNFLQVLEAKRDLK